MQVQNKKTEQRLETNAAGDEKYVGDDHTDAIRQLVH